MLRWLRKTKERPEKEMVKPHWSSKARKYLLDRQRKLADQLNNGYSVLTVREQKIVWAAIFCALFTLSGWILFEGVSNTSRKDAPAFLHRETITHPENTELPDSLNIKWLEEEQFQRLERRPLPDTISTTK